MTSKDAAPPTHGLYLASSAHSCSKRHLRRQRRRQAQRRAVHRSAVEQGEAGAVSGTGRPQEQRPDPEAAGPPGASSAAAAAGRAGHLSASSSRRSTHWTACTLLRMLSSLPHLSPPSPKAAHSGSRSATRRMRPAGPGKQRGCRPVDARAGQALRRSMQHAAGRRLRSTSGCGVQNTCLRVPRGRPESS